MQEVITHLTDFVSLVAALCAGYLLNGWPFVLAHLFVAYLIRNSWLELNHEKVALEKWQMPDAKESTDTDLLSSLVTDSAKESTPARSSPQVPSSPRERRETIVVLEQFIEESRVLGGKGLFVPMTDFSDRLDSAVEGKIAELHDRTNLFLYVGIAGTMFGVFEFAFRSYTLMVSGVAQSEKVIKLGEYLSGSMSKAFPVGFFGLLFTFIAQIIATRPEQQLRAELSEATRKALEARQAATHSQAELLQNAAASIAQAMRPLKDLKDTLSESLKPVVEVFGARLDKSLGLLETQFKRLDQTSTGLQAAVDNVRQAIGSVADATKSLDSLIKDTPRVINRLLDLEKKHESSLEKIDALFIRHFEQADELSKSLKEAVEDLSSLSKRVIEETSAGIKRIENASVAGWTSAADELRTKLEKDLASLFLHVGARMAELTTTIDKALATMNSLGSKSAASIAEIEKVAPQIAEGYKQSLQKVGEESVALWKKLIEGLDKDLQNQYLPYLNEVQKGTSKSSDALTKAAEEWSDLARSSKVVLKEPVVAAVAEARKDLVELLRSVDTNVEDRIRQFSGELKDLQTSTGQLVDKVAAINAGLSKWVAEAAPLAKEMRGVTSSLQEQSKSQADILKRLQTTTEKLAKIANRPVAPTRTGNITDGGPKAIVIESTGRDRVWWKPTTWRNRQR